MAGKLLWSHKIAQTESKIENFTANLNITQYAFVGKMSTVDGYVFTQPKCVLRFKKFQQICPKVLNSATKILLNAVKKWKERSTETVLPTKATNFCRLFDSNKTDIAVAWQNGHFSFAFRNFSQRSRFVSFSKNRGCELGNQVAIPSMIRLFSNIFQNLINFQL